MIKRLALVLIFTPIFLLAMENEQDLAYDFFVGAASGAAAMVPYTPFHYWQNRTVQGLGIDPNIRTWFRGFPALAVGRAPLEAGRLMTYEVAKKYLHDEDGNVTDMDRLAAATMAGTTAGIINNVTHLIALHQENSGNSFVQTTRQLPSLTRGLGTAIAKETIFSIIFLQLLAKAQGKIEKNVDDPTIASVASGLASGALIAGSTQPFMVVSAHLYADVEKKKYKNGLDVIRTIVEKEGVSGFYKGCAYRCAGIICALPVLHNTQDYLLSNKKTIRSYFSQLYS